MEECHFEKIVHSGIILQDRRVSFPNKLVHSRIILQDRRVSFPKI